MHCLIPFEGKYFTFLYDSSPSGMEIKKKNNEKIK